MSGTETDGATTFAILQVDRDGRIAVRARAPLRQPRVRFWLDDFPIGQATGRMAPQDDQADATAEVPPWAFDGLPWSLRAVADDGRALAPPDGLTVRFRRRLSGAFETAALDGRVIGHVDAPGLRLSWLCCRLLVDGEHEIPFELGPDDLERRPAESITRFRFRLRLPRAMRTGRPVGLALCVDGPSDSTVVAERVALPSLWSPSTQGRRDTAPRLVIADSSLMSERGHQIPLAGLIATAARRAGAAPVIAAHRALDGRFVCGETATGRFSMSVYDVAALPGALDRMLAFHRFRATHLAELKACMAADAAEGGWIFYPTVNEYNLPVIVEAAAAGPPGLRHLVCLMLETGIAVRDGMLEVVDPAQADLYRDSFARLETAAGADIRLFAMSQTQRLCYQSLTALPVEPIPPLFGFSSEMVAQTPPRARGGRRRILLYAGEAKRNKGFCLAPDVLERLMAERSDLEFAIHVHNAAGPDVAPAADRLRALARRPGFRGEIVEGFLDGPGFARMLLDVDVAILGYDPRRYAAKTSGVFWEATSFGAAIVIPARSWLHSEARLLDVPHETFERHCAAEIADAASRLLARPPTPRAAAVDVAAAADAFFATVLADRPGTARYASLGQPGDPPPGVPVEAAVRLAERFEMTAADARFREGWTEAFRTPFARTGRWMGRRADIELPVWRRAPRRVRLRGEDHGSPERLSTLCLRADGRPLEDLRIDRRNAVDFVATATLPASGLMRPTILNLTLDGDGDRLAVVTTIEVA